VLGEEWYWLMEYLVTPCTVLLFSQTHTVLALQVPTQATALLITPSLVSTTHIRHSVKSPGLCSIGRHSVPPDSQLHTLHRLSLRLTGAQPSVSCKHQFFYWHQQSQIIEDSVRVREINLKRMRWALIILIQII